MLEGGAVGPRASLADPSAATWPASKAGAANRSAKKRHRIPSGVSSRCDLAVASVRFAGWESYRFDACAPKKSRFYAALLLRFSWRTSLEPFYPSPWPFVMGTKCLKIIDTEERTVASK